MCISGLFADKNENPENSGRRAGAEETGQRTNV